VFIGVYCHQSCLVMTVGIGNGGMEGMQANRISNELVECILLFSHFVFL
jgi:hypothetical protein